MGLESVKTLEVVKGLSILRSFGALRDLDLLSFLGYLNSLESLESFWVIERIESLKIHGVSRSLLAASRFLEILYLILLEPFGFREALRSLGLKSLGIL